MSHIKTISVLTSAGDVRGGFSVVGIVSTSDTGLCGRALPKKLIN